jgi:photosystem II stability/assembly factor-like uncharacterized protein
VIESGLPVAELSDGHHCSFGFPMVMDRRTHSVFVVPLDGDNFRFPRGGQLAVYRTRDGESWQPRTTGLPGNFFGGVLRGSMSADQLDPGGVFMGTTSGALYGSRDTGESWREVAAGLPRITNVEAYER